MLTKQEQDVIVKIIDSGDSWYLDIYKYLLNDTVPGCTSIAEDVRAMFKRLIELCDVSNTMELSRDRDGKYIHLGDTVYGCDDRAEYRVCGISVFDTYTEVTLLKKGVCGTVTKLPNNVTHENPTKIRLLAKQVRNVLDNEGDSLTTFGFNDLSRIADELESLVDNEE